MILIRSEVPVLTGPRGQCIIWCAVWDSNPRRGYAPWIKSPVPIQLGQRRMKLVLPAGVEPAVSDVSDRRFNLAKLRERDYAFYNFGVPDQI